ncbi:hypothetical protein M9H77_33896 [Catharanthus roseus]|uniref:Uncharacterized protein n=1 Tax=Catharanthus roseus TaxID=4058 RepID=A0ACB9ZM36_CATRO|nr:hypothetical protein M9H77_33896 [Catharanthus roseus]
MDWVYPRRRGPEWKLGWTGQTMASLSLPPIPLLIIFAIVIVLLPMSLSTNYKEQLDRATIVFQLLLLMIPLVLVFIVRSSFTNWNFNLWVPRPRRPDGVQRGGGGFPWGITILLVVLLLLVSYQSSFRSKWFLPSD